MSQIKATLSFYLGAPEPNKQLFPWAASHCRMCQYQYSLNNQTDDRRQNTWDSPEAFWTITHSQRGSGLCLLFFNLDFNFFIFSRLFLSFLHAHYKQTHTHSRIKAAMQAKGYSSLGDYLPTFHPSASNLQHSDRQSLRPHFSSAAVWASAWPWPEQSLSH